MIYHIVIRLAYTAIITFCNYLDESSVKYIVAQHDADEDIKTTHCHIAVDYEMTKTALQKAMKAANVSGRDKSSVMEKTLKTKELYDYDKLAVYMSKGSPENFMKSKGTSVEAYTAIAAQWVTPAQTTETWTKMPKEQKDKTRWTVIQDIIDETKKISGVWVKAYEDPFGAQSDTPTMRIKEHQTVFRTMIKHLKENKISTSRNELERMYVTILRHDPTSVDNIFASIHQNVFRNQ